MGSKIRQDWPTCRSRLATAIRLLVVSDSGQEILEAAIVLPILFLVLLAIFWFGRAFNISSTLDRAAREGVKAASQPSCATCGNTLQTPSQILVPITDVLNADHLKVASLITYAPAFACTGSTPAPTCTTLQNVQICTNVPLTCGNAACQTPPIACGTNPELGVRVSFAYQSPSPLAIANLPAITIHASAQSEPEQ